MATEQNTNVAHTAPSDTASPGFHLPDTLDWSSLFAQMKNRLIVMPSVPLRWAESTLGEEDGTDDSRAKRLGAHRDG